MTNVLIVDDEKIEREGLKYLLSREEGERTVFEAANGKQALQVLRSEDIQRLHLCAGGDPLRCDRIHPQTGKSG